MGDTVPQVRKVKAAFLEGLARKEIEDPKVQQDLLDSQEHQVGRVLALLGSLVFQGRGDLRESQASQGSPYLGPQVEMDCLGAVELLVPQDFQEHQAQAGTAFQGLQGYLAGRESRDTPEPLDRKVTGETLVSTATPKTSPFLEPPGHLGPLDSQAVLVGQGPKGNEVSQDHQGQLEHWVLLG
ncbi:hypothetical protein SKAU_G00270640 [Synaphobranchus kaupii]|uniref:Uncharacterized protein n=1 Tax=Synaphobranchus kaupii TaxID=118154 RepID=A0A9Q1F070_SYNKA|nr:hypothetical protein SKAU_G00270640 [Synaphobranchus kaupii]